MASPRPEPDRRSLSIWVIIASIVGVSAILVLGYFLFFRQEYALLYKDLRPAAAAPIVAELKKQRVPYRLRNGGAEILVPAANLDSVRLSVAGADISAGGLNGFELFDSSDMGLTDFAQKIKFQRALQGELTRTILLINGVADARVHLSLPEKSLFRGDAASAKASVTLITRSSEPMNPAEIEGVQELIASAIPDLASQDVVVLNGRGEVISVRPQPVGVQPPSSDGAPVNIQALPKGDATQLVEAKLLALLQQTLPAKRIQLHMEAAKPAARPAGAEAASTATASAADPADLADSQGKSGPTPSRLQVATDTELSASEQELVRVAIGRAGLTAPTTSLAFVSGDAVQQTSREAPAALSLPGVVEAPQTPVLSNEPAPPAAEEKTRAPTTSLLDSPGMLVISGLFAAAGFVIAIGLLLARRAPGPRRVLVLEDHSRFAERLRAGLAAQEQESSPHAA